MKLEHLAVSNAHGWCRHSDFNTAVSGALSYSSYVNEGDEVEVTIYRVEKGTQFSNSGRFYIQDEEDEDPRPPEKCEETHTITFRYKGGDSMGAWNWKKVDTEWPDE